MLSHYYTYYINDKLNILLISLQEMIRNLLCVYVRVCVSAVTISHPQKFS